MTRRAWILGILGVTGALASQIGPVEPAIAPCGSGPHSFSCFWNEWVKCRGSRGTGTLDVHEIQLWNQVKHAWREVKMAVDQEYGV